MKKFESALKNARPMKGQLNDWQYVNIKSLLPADLSFKEYEIQIKRICEKINF